MAFDPPYKEAAESFINENPSYKFRPMQGNTERELKFNPLVNRGNVIALPQNSESRLSQGALVIKALLSNLKDEGVWFDPNGVIPNDYVLASLNLDTMEGTLPTAQFFRNGWQCRVRKPLFVHDGEEGFNFAVTMRQLDANMKTFQSDKNLEEHRIELEEVIKYPSVFLRDFRKAGNLPEFTHGIEDKNIRVSDICLTSRTGFYIIIKDPQSDNHVLLHGTYDASKFTTSHADIFTGNMRLELEMEAKGIIGGNVESMDANEQDVIVNRVFAMIRNQTTALGMSEITRSKLEESLALVKAHYDHGKDFKRFRKHLDDNGVSHSGEKEPTLSHLYALANGRTVVDMFSTLREEELGANICQRAADMPDPRTMLSLSDIGQRHLAVA